ELDDRSTGEMMHQRVEPPARGRQRTGLRLAFAAVREERERLVDTVAIEHGVERLAEELVGAAAQVVTGVLADLRDRERRRDEREKHAVRLDRARDVDRLPIAIRKIDGIYSRLAHTTSPCRSIQHARVVNVSHAAVTISLS